MHLTRSICAMHSICLRARGIYIISNLPSGKYIDFAKGKNIELRSNISTKKSVFKWLFYCQISVYRTVS